MDDNKLYEFYEKLYFHEIEVRESITARLQLPLAILLSVISLYALIIQDITLDIKNDWVVLFAIASFISIWIYIESVYYFVGAFYGAEYQLIPPASKLNQYRAGLASEYAKYDGSDGYETCAQLVARYFSVYLIELYVDSSSKNSIVNDFRSYKLHKCNSRIIFNILPLIIIFLTYCYGNIKIDHDNKEFNVNITKPITLQSEASTINIKQYEHHNLSKPSIDKEPSMTNPAPPAPTTPKPEPRQIKEGYRPQTPSPTPSKK